MSKHHPHGEHHRPHHHKHREHHKRHAEAATPLKRIVIAIGVVAALVLGTWMFATAFNIADNFQTAQVQHTAPVVVSPPAPEPAPEIVTAPGQSDPAPEVVLPQQEEPTVCGAVNCNNEPPVVALPAPEPIAPVVVTPHHREHHHWYHRHHHYHKHRHHHHRHHRGAPGGMWMAPVAF